MCGSESHEDIAVFGNAQIDWFRQFILLKNGMPSHDTFRRVLMLLKPGSLSDACNEMFHGLHIDKQGKYIAIDGKTSRGCYNVWCHQRNNKGKSLLNMVSADHAGAGRFCDSRRSLHRHVCQPGRACAAEDEPPPCDARSRLGASLPQQPRLHAHAGTGKEAYANENFRKLIVRGLDWIISENQNGK